MNVNHFMLFRFLCLIFFGEENHIQPTCTFRDQNGISCTTVSEKNTREWFLTWCYIYTSAVRCIPEADTLDNFYVKISSKKVKSQCRNWFLGLAVSPVCTVALGKALVLSVNFSLSATGMIISIMEGGS